MGILALIRSLMTQIVSLPCMAVKKNSRICYLLFLKLKFSMFFEEILREKGIFFVIPAANFSFGWDLLPTIVFLLNF